MIKKKVLRPERVRRIHGGFSFIPHRFLIDGFLASLDQKQLLLYLFLCLASDRDGLSFYSYDAICTLVQLTLDEYIEARKGLVKKDLIAFDGTIFQVLDLPSKPIKASKTKPVGESDRSVVLHDFHESGDRVQEPVSLGQLFRQSFMEANHDR
jgi:hypothetical protein